MKFKADLPFDDWALEMAVEHLRIVCPLYALIQRFCQYYTLNQLRRSKTRNSTLYAMLREYRVWYKQSQQVQQAPVTGADAGILASLNQRDFFIC